MQTNYFGFQTVRWVGQLIAGLSQRGFGLDPKSVDVGCVADKVAMGQVFLPVLCFFLVIIIPLCFFLVIIIPSMLHTHLYLNNILIGKNIERLGQPRIRER